MNIDDMPLSWGDHLNVMVSPKVGPWCDLGYKATDVAFGHDPIPGVVTGFARPEYRDSYNTDNDPRMVFIAGMEHPVSLGNVSVVSIIP